MEEKRVVSKYLEYREKCTEVNLEELIKCH